MVPLTAPLLLRDAEATLRELAVQDPDGRELHRYMSAWFGAESLTSDDELFVQASEPLRSYQAIACLAFVEAGGAGGVGARLDEGLHWLQACSLDRGAAPAPVTTDAVALLAIGLAARQRPWLREWHQRACAYAAANIEPSWLRGAHELARGDTSASVRSDVRLALASKGITQPSSGDEEEVLRQLVAGEFPQEALHARVALAALHWIRRAFPIVQRGRAEVGDVVALLGGVERALQEWTWEENPRTRNAQPRKWFIDNEYHVQNLLWTILAPVFPDLRREEFRSPVGPVQPRIDLAIPSLRLIIEVKFARSPAALRGVVNEIAEDVSLYFVETTVYDQLLVFVWDDSRHAEEHDTLITGLQRLQRVRGATVVSRPGKMIEAVPVPSPPSAPPSPSAPSS